MTRLFAPFGFDLPVPWEQASRQGDLGPGGFTRTGERHLNRAQGAALRRTVKVPALR
jgi:hypothetical protein